MKNTDTVFETKALEVIAEKTPFFVISEKRILNKLHEFKSHFNTPLIQYAMKANSEEKVLRTVADAGFGFEVASIYELEMLRKIQVPADRIIFGTSIKPAAHIREFFAYGVDRFPFDSYSELEKIAANAPGSKVYIRLSVNDADSVFKFSEKFGTTPEHVVPLVKQAKELGLTPYGISFHVGSQAGNPHAWLNALKVVAPLIVELKDLGIEFEVLNIGGGFPCNTYASSSIDLNLQEIAEGVHAECAKLPYKIKLMLEPGRGIVADSSVVVTSIIGKVSRNGSTWLFLDAGVYNGLYEVMAFQGSTRYRITSMRPSHDAGQAFFAIAGPTGDSQDVVSREVLLPEDIDVGDKLIIHDVGAYSLVTTSPFNGFPKPAVHFI